MPNAKTTRGSFATSASDNARVVKKLVEHKLELYAQVHTHGSSSVEHSYGDIVGALMPYEGFLSIVVPHYGRNSMWPLYNCGVYRFEGGRFVRLSPNEIDETIKLVPSLIDLRERAL
jgi:hypothetical protein